MKRANNDRREPGKIILINGASRAGKSAGNNVIVDHILEQEQWLADLVQLRAPFDVFFVGVHCPLGELEC